MLALHSDKLSNVCRLDGPYACLMHLQTVLIDIFFHFSSVHSNATNKNQPNLIYGNTLAAGCRGGNCSIIREGKFTQYISILSNMALMARWFSFAFIPNHDISRSLRVCVRLARSWRNKVCVGLSSLHPTLLCVIYPGRLNPPALFGLWKIASN